MALAGQVPVGQEPVLGQEPLPPSPPPLLAGKDSATWTSCDTTPSSNSFAKLSNSSLKCWSPSCNSLGLAILSWPS